MSDTRDQLQEMNLEHQRLSEELAERKHALAELVERDRSLGPLLEKARADLETWNAKLSRAQREHSVNQELKASYQITLLTEELARLEAEAERLPPEIDAQRSALDALSKSITALSMRRSKGRSEYALASAQQALDQMQTFLKTEPSAAIISELEHTVELFERLPPPAVDASVDTLKAQLAELEADRVRLRGLVERASERAHDWRLKAAHAEKSGRHDQARAALEVAQRHDDARIECERELALHGDVIEHLAKIVATRT